MVNSATFDTNASIGQGDRNAAKLCTHPCQNNVVDVSPRTIVSRSSPHQKTSTDGETLSTTLLQVAVTSKTESSESNISEDSVTGENPVIAEEDNTLCCSVPLDKVQEILTPFHQPKCDEPKPTRKLLCLYCERTFASVNLRQKHVERIHSVKKNRRLSSRKQQLTLTPCIYCDKLNGSENTVSELFQHLVNEHSSKYFGCLSCEERFLTATLLNDHNAAVHPMVEIPKNIVQLTITENDLLEKEASVKLTRSRTKPKLETTENSKKLIVRTKNAKLKELRSKKLTVKSSRIAFNRRESKRLQALAKLTEAQKKKRQKPIDRKLANISKPEAIQDKAKPTSICVNPYPEFDNFYRVKKITDHSIDNLKISSLTFDDVFDKAFFNRIKCNIEENLLHHIDGKLFKNEESESRISNFEKVSTIQQEVQNSTSENYGCELSLNAVTPVAALSLNSQFGEDFEYQIEYGSKPSKKKTQTKKDEVHYKYFTRRKFQASILEHKENRDLSKLDMWTQLVIKKRQQKIIDDKKTAKEILEYATCDEYKNEMLKEEMNRILDRRGPFEDLREEASKKAALDKLNSVSEDSISHESFTEVREVLNEILNRVFAATEEKVEVVDQTTDSQILTSFTKFNSKPDLRDIPSFLNLRPSLSLPSEDEMDQSDKITLICSSQDTENFELPTNATRGKNELIELSGEWARCRMYICAACGAKLPNMKYLLDHKTIYHQNVWVQHYEFVGNQSELYRHLSIPTLGKVGYIEENVACKLWKRSDARVCSKCKKQCNSLGELHRHILECGGDWSWILVRKKCKYRYGAKSRRRRRGMVLKVHAKRKTDSTEKKIYKYDGPRQRPSDAETIQRMLANLPAKRSTRKLISLYDGVRRRQKNKGLENVKQKKVKCGKVIYDRSSNIKETTEKTINTAVPLKKSQINNKASNARSLRSLNRVLSSRILDTSTKLTVKRKLKVLNERRKTRQSMIIEENKQKKEKNEDASQSPKEIRKIKTESSKDLVPKRTSPRSAKMVRKMKLFTGNLNIKSFFPIKKRKDKKELKDETSPENKDIKTRSRKKSNEIEDEMEKVESLDEKVTKSDKFSNLVRSLSINKKKNSKKPSQDKPSDDIAQEVISKKSSSKEELELSKRKRKLKQSFRNVINRVKRLKIDTAPETVQTQVTEKSQTLSKSPFLEESKQEKELPVKVVIPLNTEAKENIADISETAHTVIAFDETNEDSPVPENIFKLDSNDEKNLQAKGEPNFDTQLSTQEKTMTENEIILPKEKLEPISIETSFKPKVFPMISPNIKGKIRKPARGLNDCIAMLTSKLQQKPSETIIKPTTLTVLPSINPPKKVADPSPHILKIPTFKTLNEPEEETALDLSTKPRNEKSGKAVALKLNTFPINNKPIFEKDSPWDFSRLTSVERIIENVVSNKFVEPQKLEIVPPSWNSLDQTIQNVIDGHLKHQKMVQLRTTVDDIIDYVIHFGTSPESNYLNKIVPLFSTDPIVLPLKTNEKTQKVEPIQRLMKNEENMKNKALAEENEFNKDNHVLETTNNIEAPSVINNSTIPDLEKSQLKATQEKIKKVVRKMGQIRKSRNKSESPEKLLIETNLDNLLNIKEIENKVPFCHDLKSDEIAIVDEGEPYIMENKTVNDSSVPNLFKSIEPNLNPTKEQSDRILNKSKQNLRNFRKQNKGLKIATHKSTIDSVNNIQNNRILEDTNIPSKKHAKTDQSDNPVVEKLKIKTKKNSGIDKNKTSKKKTRYLGELPKIKDVLPVADKETKDDTESAPTITNSIPPAPSKNLIISFKTKRKKKGMKKLRFTKKKSKKLIATFPVSTMNENNESDIYIINKIDDSNIETEKRSQNIWSSDTKPLETIENEDQTIINNKHKVDETVSLTDTDVSNNIKMSKVQKTKQNDKILTKPNQPHRNKSTGTILKPAVLSISSILKIEENKSTENTEIVISNQINSEVLDAEINKKPIKRARKLKRLNNLRKKTFKFLPLSFSGDADETIVEAIDTQTPTLTNISTELKPENNEIVVAGILKDEIETKQKERIDDDTFKENNESFKIILPENPIKTEKEKSLCNLDEYPSEMNNLEINQNNGAKKTKSVKLHKMPNITNIKKNSKNMVDTKSELETEQSNDAGLEIKGKLPVRKSKSHTNMSAEINNEHNTDNTPFKDELSDTENVTEINDEEIQTLTTKQSRSAENLKEASDTVIKNIEDNLNKIENNLMEKTENLKQFGKCNPKIPKKLPRGKIKRTNKEAKKRYIEDSDLQQTCVKQTTRLMENLNTDQEISSLNFTEPVDLPIEQRIRLTRTTKSLENLSTDIDVLANKEHVKPKTRNKKTKKPLGNIKTTLEENTSLLENSEYVEFLKEQNTSLIRTTKSLDNLNNATENEYVNSAALSKIRPKKSKRSLEKIKTALEDTTSLLENPEHANFTNEQKTVLTRCTKSLENLSTAVEEETPLKQIQHEISVVKPKKTKRSKDSFKSDMATSLLLSDNTEHIFTFQQDIGLIKPLEKTEHATNFTKSLEDLSTSDEKETSIVEKEHYAKSLLKTKLKLKKSKRTKNSLRETLEKDESFLESPENVKFSIEWETCLTKSLENVSTVTKEEMLIFKQNDNANYLVKPKILSKNLTTTLEENATLLENLEKVNLLVEEESGLTEPPKNISTDVEEETPTYTQKELANSFAEHKICSKKSRYKKNVRAANDHDLMEEKTRLTKSLENLSTAAKKEMPKKIQRNNGSYLAKPRGRPKKTKKALESLRTENTKHDDVVLEQETNLKGTKSLENVTTFIEETSTILEDQTSSKFELNIKSNKKIAIEEENKPLLENLLIPQESELTSTKRAWKNLSVVEKDTQILENNGLNSECKLQSDKLKIPLENLKPDLILENSLSLGDLSSEPSGTVKSLEGLSIDIEKQAILRKHEFINFIAEPKIRSKKHLKTADENNTKILEEAEYLDLPIKTKYRSKPKKLLKNLKKHLIRTKRLTRSLEILDKTSKKNPVLELNIESKNNTKLLTEILKSTLEEDTPNLVNLEYENVSDIEPKISVNDLNTDQVGTPIKPRSYKKSIQILPKSTDNIIGKDSNLTKFNLDLKRRSKRTVPLNKSTASLENLNTQSKSSAEQKGMITLTQRPSSEISIDLIDIESKSRTKQRKKSANILTKSVSLENFNINTSIKTSTSETVELEVDQLISDTADLDTTESASKVNKHNEDICQYLENLNKVIDNDTLEKATMNIEKEEEDSIFEDEIGHTAKRPEESSINKTPKNTLKQNVESGVSKTRSSNNLVTSSNESLSKLNDSLDAEVSKIMGYSGFTSSDKKLNRSLKTRSVSLKNIFDTSPFTNSSESESSPQKPKRLNRTSLGESSVQFSSEESLSASISNCGNATSANLQEGHFVSLKSIRPLRRSRSLKNVSAEKEDLNKVDSVATKVIDKELGKIKFIQNSVSEKTPSNILNDSFQDSEEITTPDVELLEEKIRNAIRKSLMSLSDFTEGDDLNSTNNLRATSTPEINVASKEIPTKDNSGDIVETSKKIKRNKKYISNIKDLPDISNNLDTNNASPEDNMGNSTKEVEKLTDNSGDTEKTSKRLKRNKKSTTNNNGLPDISNNLETNNTSLKGDMSISTKEIEDLTDSSGNTEETNKIFKRNKKSITDIKYLPNISNNLEKSLGNSTKEIEDITNNFDDTEISKGLKRNKKSITNIEGLPDISNNLETNNASPEDTKVSYMKDVEDLTDNLGDTEEKSKKLKRNKKSITNIKGLPDISNKLETNDTSTKEVEDVTDNSGGTEETSKGFKRNKKSISNIINTSSEGDMGISSNRSLRKKSAVNYAEVEEIKEITEDQTNDARPSDSDMIEINHSNPIIDSINEIAQDPIAESKLNNNKKDEADLKSEENSYILKENLSKNKLPGANNGINKGRAKLRARKGKRRFIRKQKSAVLVPEVDIIEATTDIVSVISENNLTTESTASMIPKEVEAEAEKEPSIKIIINKHKARRKSKSIKKVGLKGHNHLYEDFSLVIKKKRKAPIITFSPPDTFSKEDTYPMEVHSVGEPKEEFGDSVEEIDMELDEISIKTNIIENSNLSILADVEIEPKVDEIINNTQNLAIKTKKIGRKKRGKSRNVKKKPLPSSTDFITENTTFLENTISEIPLFKLNLKSNSIENDNYITDIVNESISIVANNFVLDKDDFSSDDFEVDNSFEDSIISEDNTPKKPSLDANILFDKLIKNSEFVKPLVLKKSKILKKKGRKTNNQGCLKDSLEKTPELELDNDALLSKMIPDDVTDNVIVDSSFNEEETTAVEIDKEKIKESNSELSKPVKKLIKKGKKKGNRKTLQFGNLKSGCLDNSNQDTDIIEKLSKEILQIETKMPISSTEDPTLHFKELVPKANELRKEDIDKLYAFSETEDFEIEKPIELPKRLPRKNDNIEKIDIIVQDITSDKGTTRKKSKINSNENFKEKPELNFSGVFNEEKVPETKFAKGKSKELPIALTEKEIKNTAFVLDEFEGRKSMRNAKAKALESIHDEALAELTDVDINGIKKVLLEPENKKSNKKGKKQSAINCEFSAIVCGNNELATTESNNDLEIEQKDTELDSNIKKSTKKQKKTEKLLQLANTFDIPRVVLGSKAPLLEDLVAELNGLEELENSIERELNAEMNLENENECNKKTDNNLYPEEPLDNNSTPEENQELRRSRRGSRKVASYNENDLIDPIIDALEDKRLGKRKDDKNSLEAKKKKDAEKKLNSEQLFDLLKSSTVDNLFVPKQQNTFFNNLEDSSRDVTDENFDNMFENMLEKTALLTQQKSDVDKIYEFTESPDNVDSLEHSIKSKKLEDIEAISLSQDSTSESKSRSDEFESNYCKICNKSFVKLENLIKHRRTLTHIQKLSEIEAKEAEKSKIISRHEDENSSESVIVPPSLSTNSDFQKSNLKIDDILVSQDNIQSPLNANHSLKLADIISDVLNKPISAGIDEPNTFSDIILQNETKRYKSLGERKSFDSDSILMSEAHLTEQFEAKTTKTILEKQISLLENIIENQTTNNYIDDISLSSEKSDTPFECNSPVKLKPITNNDSFLKPTQYEEISEDSANLRNYDDQKLRKTLNRDEELFLECCSLLKSSSEVSSNYSNKKMHDKVINAHEINHVDKPNWMEKKNILQENNSNAVDDYSDNSRIPTPLGNSYDDEASNSNTISSNWGMDKPAEESKEEVEGARFNFKNITESKNQIDDNTNINGLLSHNRIDFLPSDKTLYKSSNEELSDGSLYDNKKIMTKGARKVFEGLKVSIPTEELNLEEVLNYSPKQKKTELTIEKNSEEDKLCSPPSKRKSKPVKKSQVGSNLLFKVNKKKLPSPSIPKDQQDDKGYDVYDFEETQDHTDVLTKPNYRTFRILKAGENESEGESQDCTDSFVGPESVTSKISTTIKKSKAQESITKKKCMIMGRIFKNAAKTKADDIDEEIRSIPIINNKELVENYVADCKKVIKSGKSEPKPNLPEEEFDTSDLQVEDKLDLGKDQKKFFKAESKKQEAKKKAKLKGKKRVRTNSDSTDDEFGLCKTIKRKTSRKNAKEEDNCINLEQELKECIGVASRKSQRKCTSGKQNVLVEYWSSDDSQFEALLEKQIIEIKPKPQPVETIVEPIETEVLPLPEPPIEPKKTLKKKSLEKKKSKSQEHRVDGGSSNRRKRAAVNPLYHWSSSSEDEANDLIEVKPLRDELEYDEDRPVQHGWIVGDSPKKLVTMLAQAKGKKIDIDCVKEQGKKRTNTVS